MQSPGIRPRTARRVSSQSALAQDSGLKTNVQIDRRGRDRLLSVLVVFCQRHSIGLDRRLEGNREMQKRDVEPRGGYPQSDQ
jgi:hypothetical protein